MRPGFRKSAGISMSDRRPSVIVVGFRIEMGVGIGAEEVDIVSGCSESSDDSNLEDLC